MMEQSVRQAGIFDQQIGFLMWDTERRIAREFAARASRHGINSGLVPFLRVLEKRDGLTQQQLADTVTMRSSTAAKALQQLERLQLIHRQPSTSDKRKVDIYLTDKGRALVRKIAKEAAAMNARLLDGFQKQEVDLLRRFLYRMRENLSGSLFSE
jgi:DNA-binding MarR family transcriptional regulator